MINKNFKPFNKGSDPDDIAEEYTQQEPSDNVAANAKTTDKEDSANAATATQPDEQAYTPINQWAKEDRPREKLMKKGPGALTNAELLAILIGNGTAKTSAVDLMREVLKSCNNSLRGLNRLTLQDLMRFNGIGEAKAITIIAAAELGKRRLREKGDDIPHFRTGEQVMTYMQPYIQDLNHEESWVLLLNNQAQLINSVKLSTGGLTQTAVDVRMLLKQVLLHDATCFILVHNHPSGNTRPSRADDDLTQRVKRAADAINVRMLDHVVVTEGDYYSYNENGKI